MISGVPVDCGPPEDVVAAIDAKAAEGQLCLGYVNTHTAYLLGRDGAYRALCRRFMLLNDGVGLDALSLIKYGRGFEFNLNGSDFTPIYLKATRHRYRVFVLGGRSGVAERAVAALQQIAPQHTYVGSHRGHLEPHEEAAVVAAINASRADLLIVGFGNPEQERWIARHAADLDARVLVGVGALLDFLAGSVLRAPRWMQRARIEWMHRLALEPRRLWRRYVIFTPLVLLSAVTERARAWTMSLLPAITAGGWLDPLDALAFIF